jgi:hypothetical protein
MKDMNIIGLFDELVFLINEPRKAVPWGIRAKEKGELPKPGKASAAKKKHRKVVKESRRKNRN